MKIPQFALNGSYLPTSSSGHHGNTSSRHGNGKSYLNNTSECDNSSVLSPTRSPCDEHNLMVDMAVAKDKTPFLLANKANDNLQRALNRFMVYHEREKKVKLRLLYTLMINPISLFNINYEMKRWFNNLLERLNPCCHDWKRAHHSWWTGCFCKKNGFTKSELLDAPQLCPEAKAKRLTLF